MKIVMIMFIRNQDTIIISSALLEPLVQKTENAKGIENIKLKHRIGKKVLAELCVEDIDCIGVFKCLKSENDDLKRCQYILDDMPCESTNCSFSRGEECFCVSNNGTSESVCKVSDVPQLACNYTDVAIAYQQCWKDHGCPLDFYQKENGIVSFFTESIPNGSCMSEKCGHILKKLLCCANQLMTGSEHEKLNKFPYSCDEFPSLIVPTIILFVLSMIIVSISTLIIFGTSVSQLFLKR